MLFVQEFEPWWESCQDLLKECSGPSTGLLESRSSLGWSWAEPPRAGSHPVGAHDNGAVSVSEETGWSPLNRIVTPKSFI